MGTLLLICNLGARARYARAWGRGFGRTVCVGVRHASWGVRRRARPRPSPPHPTRAVARVVRTGASGKGRVCLGCFSDWLMTFEKVHNDAALSLSAAAVLVSPRNVRSTRRPLRSSRGAQGAHPLQNRAHRSSPHTGVELDVPRGFFPAQGFAPDFRLRGCGGRPRRPPRSSPGR